MFRPILRVHAQDVKRIVLANAVGASALTVKVGDLITLGATTHAKYATNATTSSKILGVVTSLVQSGKVSEKTSATGVNATTAVNANSGVVSNDNETYKTWAVDYIPSYIPMEYEIDVGAPLVTTTDSDGIGSYFTITSGSPGVLLETSALIWSTAVTSAEQVTVTGVPAGSNALTTGATTNLKVLGRISPTFII
jgi:hypothetical protein